MNNGRNFIVSWTNVQDNSDVYMCFESIKDARNQYDAVLEAEHLRCCTISAVIESTDYETHPSLKALDRNYRQVDAIRTESSPPIKPTEGTVKNREEEHRLHECDVFDRLRHESYIGDMTAVEAWDWVNKNRDLIRNCSDDGLNPFDTIDLIQKYNGDYTGK